jgi:hypothetical protein
MSSKKTPSLVFSLINKSLQDVIQVLFSTPSAKKTSLMQEFDPSSGFLFHQY